MLDTISTQLMQSLQLLLGFTYYYPLYMAYLWMLGAVFFYFRYEFRRQQLPVIQLQPRVSIIVPCFNEEANISETISQLFFLNYQNYEIIAVNDGSCDRTGEILEQLADQDNRLRVIQHAKNQGKAIALNTAAHLATGQFIIGIDGDALLDSNAILWFLDHFQSSQKIGAVTGNPRIRTRSTLLGRLQVGEFSSLVGLIKRAQKIFYGHLFTASGVITAFRADALKDVDYWSPDMLTEDMDITWKLQVKGWQVGFEPRAQAWILMPETISGLWQQRLRWAMGGLQIIGKFKSMFKHWRTYPMWPLMFEHLISIVWACSVSVVFATYVFDFLSSSTRSVYQSFNTYFSDLAAPTATEIAAQQSHMIESMTALLPEFSGVIIGTTCLLQMLVAVLLDRRYDKKLLHYYLWTIWYPLGFWLINMCTIVTAIPKIVLRGSGIRARWISPDRGIQIRRSFSTQALQTKLFTHKSVVSINQDRQQTTLSTVARIQQPDSLILDQFKQQSIVYKLLSNSLTALGWGFWIYLWLPILESFSIIAGMSQQEPSAGTATLSRLMDTLSSQFFTIVVITLAFVIWSLLRKLNQHGLIHKLDKQSDKLHLDPSSHFNLITNRLIIVHHEEGTGSIKSIVALKQPLGSIPATLIAASGHFN